MRYVAVIVAAVLLVLAGCDSSQGDYWSQYYVWAVTKVAQLELQAEALPEGDPKRAEIERALSVHRATLDGRLDRLLREGVEIETPDFVLRARYVDDGSLYKTRIVVDVPAPIDEAAALEIEGEDGVSHAGRAVERFGPLRVEQLEFLERSAATTRPRRLAP